MTCSACAMGIERTLSKLNGVKSAVVNFLLATALIEYDDKFVSLDKIKESINSIGFEVLDDSKILDESIKNKNTKLKFKLLVLIIITIPLLYIAMAPMINFINLPLPSIIDIDIKPVNYALTQLLMCIIVIALSFNFYKVGYKSLLKGNPNMDTLIAIGTTASFVYSIYSLYKIIFGDYSYVHNLYFESTATILTLVTLGKYIESKAKGKTNSAISKLTALTPKKGTVIRDGEMLEVNIENIQLGDIVVVKPGDKVPVDGIIIEGNTSIDESMITGESIPVDKNINDRVIAGTINSEGVIKFRAEKIGKDTMLSQIVKLIEEAQNSKAPIASIANKVSGYFTVVILVIAIIVGIIWLIITKDISFALKIFVSILVIACPCALGLATPVSIMVGTGKGAEKGILFKDSIALENLHKIDKIILDKTGTITEGRLQLTKIVTKLNEKEFISIVASVENYSKHPLAIAITQHAKSEGIKLKSIENFKSLTGVGITANVDKDIILIGNEKLMESCDIELEYEDEASILENEGNTLIYVAVNNKNQGIIALKDTLRENAKETIEKLKNMNIQPIMVTGDNGKVANIIAKEVGIESVFAKNTPNEKAEKIKQLKNDGYIVAMIGDGINDAVALTSADVAISISSGTDIAIESASVILMRNDISTLITAINLSKAVIKNIKQNLFWAFCYNSISIPIAAGLLYIFGGILLNPMIAALAMSLSSLSVVINSLRLNKF